MSTPHSATQRKHPDGMAGTVGDNNDINPSDPENNNDLRYVFPSHALSVRATLQDLMAALADFDLSPDAVHKVELVLAEVLNNVVKHSYANNHDGLIELRISRCEGMLACEVSDQGARMPGGIPFALKIPDLDCSPDDLPEGGFGWALIGELAENLRYSRCDGCNHLTFCLSVQHSTTAT